MRWKGTSVITSPAISTKSVTMWARTWRSASAEPALSGTTSSSTCSGPLYDSDTHVASCESQRSTVSTSTCLNECERVSSSSW
ncbi:hypothetical protein Ctob_011262 [Chrysochromulina tobinii]|uniref:Uncharacterized protein n=1 Tax=Chrysochromulina tobinii TaxID=1460289 RepID=A0A0M0JPL8_9EUKA|nr:hypothetical protein Ctob_011262 [Chrysochromulina tobinii]|eukprot:KOO28531.1 hypothetical protein Ctob_011262 [Chrysochromulina sp. CCMP291]